ncbi:MAG: helix-turn-helix domain-containing protein [Clostridia bacterium]|nr:helix-turn-helix domain-containing protein [Clostridia bacterium]
MKNSLNENIKILRTQIGMSQVDLAKALHVSKQCVSNWENDNIQPSVEMLIKMADFFHVSIDYILGRNATQSIDASSLTDEQYTHVRMIVKDFSILNDKDK